MGVRDVDIYVDRGLTGTNRASQDCERPSPLCAKATRSSSQSSDRLARSLRDARDIAEELTAMGVARELQRRRTAFLSVCEAHIF
ncbi:hypothetical protein MK786_10860 [Microbacterium sp. CFH 31415]|nr:hypothetical protein [Microbacterium sp. CFH 31415]